MSAQRALCSNQLNRIDYIENTIYFISLNSIHNFYKFEKIKFMLMLWHIHCVCVCLHACACVCAKCACVCAKCACVCKFVFVHVCVRVSLHVFVCLYL